MPPKKPCLPPPSRQSLNPNEGMPSALSDLARALPAPPLPFASRKGKDEPESLSKSKQANPTIKDLNSSLAETLPPLRSGISTIVTPETSVGSECPTIIDSGVKKKA